MSQAPNLEGYAEAQANLRARLGRDVPFFIPTPTEWPSGVPVDAQGVPIDPSVAPLASGFASATVRCSVASRPVAGALTAPSEGTPLGIRDHSSLLLVMSKTEYDENGIAGATEAELFARRYKIEAREPDQVGPGDPQRMLIFVEKK